MQPHAVSGHQSLAGRRIYYSQEDCIISLKDIAARVGIRDFYEVLPLSNSDAFIFPPDTALEGVGLRLGRR